ncbi:MAG TPA: DUF4333 domain-containing protein [Solirubrobacteraceae bacterium]|nr:DUF4333 domain-containing protein [Solirubrobacteraceae bacterium]
MSPRRALLPLLAAAVLAPAGLAACGDEGTPVGAVLDRDALAKDISTRLQQAGAGQAPPVTCPGDLPTVKDASIRCTATIGGERYGVTVSITGGSGENATYGIEVDEKPS